jgi:hypothetical protein
VLTLLTLREGRWASTRLAIITVLVFSWLSLIVTLGHIDKFHLDSGTTVEQIAAWLWLGIYVVVPVWMSAALYVAQRAEPEPAPTQPMPGGMRLALAVIAAAMLATGLVLLVDPESIADNWPWTLTPLTGRAIGTWLVALGFAGVVAIRERDLGRLGPASITFAVFAVLQGIALARFNDDVSWGEAETWVYLAWLVAMVAAGLYGALRRYGARITPPRAAAGTGTHPEA